MQPAQDPQAVLTIRDVADLLRCSKTHVSNVINGKIPGTPRLAHLSMGRRKLVRREWLDQWLEASKERC
ncbi:helix-turn-helix domain-containing protein [Bryobacter aggregatus]|uniref:helix-turn-helix domain-containing protein n=1 Tax=Bryobacter aggregatus TaxID=360054 RepID=UPI000562F42B